MTAQPGNLLKKTGYQTSHFACRDRRNASCPNPFTSDTTISPPIFSILIETARLYLSDAKLYSLQDFSDELNSRVSPSAQIATDSLKGLCEDYCSYRKCGNSTIHKPLKALYALWNEFESPNTCIYTSYMPFKKCRQMASEVTHRIHHCKGTYQEWKNKKIRF